MPEFLAIRTLVFPSTPSVASARWGEGRRRAEAPRQSSRRRHRRCDRRRYWRGRRSGIRSISRSLTTSCVCLELRPLPSPGVTQLQRYYEPLRHPSAASLSLTGVRLIIPDPALGLPVLRALSLCTCCRQYPGVAAGRLPRSSHLAVSAFPDMAVGSAYTSSFSGLARRSLALQPAHSRCHQIVTRLSKASAISLPP